MCMCVYVCICVYMCACVCVYVYALHSFCETHRWNKDLALYSKHSVFYAADDVQEDETGEGKTSVPALSEAGSTTATEQSTTLAAVQAEEATPSTAEAAPATATPTATAEKSPAAACHGSTAGKKVMTGAAKGTTRRPTTVAARSKSSPGVVKHPSAKISIRAPPKAKNGPESSATKQCEQRGEIRPRVLSTWIGLDGLVYLTSNNKQAVLPYYMRSSKDKQAHKCKEKIKKKKKKIEKKE